MKNIVESIVEFLVVVAAFIFIILLIGVFVLAFTPVGWIIVAAILFK